MRTTILFCLALVCFTACKNADKTNTETTNDSTASTPANLPYSTKQAPSWEWGTAANTATAMSALRGFETGDLDNTRQYFADSAEMNSDYFHFNGTSDSLISEMKKYRQGFSQYRIEMEDYESVKSKTTGDEYVSLWYKEYTTDSKGKSDSVYCMDDIKLSNGKITKIDTKLRHYPTSKPK